MEIIGALSGMDAGSNEVAGEIVASKLNHARKANYAEMSVCEPERPRSAVGMRPPSPVVVWTLLTEEIGLIAPLQRQKSSPCRTRVMTIAESVVASGHHAAQPWATRSRPAFQA